MFHQLTRKKCDLPLGKDRGGFPATRWIPSHLHTRPLEKNSTLTIAKVQSKSVPASQVRSCQEKSLLFSIPFAPILGNLGAVKIRRGKLRLRQRREHANHTSLFEKLAFLKAGASWKLSKALSLNGFRVCMIIKL